MLGALLLSSALRCADVAELADALDSGSSGHCARAGSSPVIRSNADKVIRNDDLFHFLENGESQVENKKEQNLFARFCATLFYV